MNNAVYREILTSAGWFDNGTDGCYPLNYDADYTYPKRPEIDSETVVAYYPGCFAEFHEGHMEVVNQAVSRLSFLTDNFVVIIAPANSDYTIQKYGDVEQASNKYRFDKIAKAIQCRSKIFIDLNPMLNFDRDQNFPDLIEHFLNRHGLTINAMKNAPHIVTGKDREYMGNIAKHTNRIAALHVVGCEASSTAIMNLNPLPRKKKNLILRVQSMYQHELFECYFADQYKTIAPILKSEEIEQALELAMQHQSKLTICKQYAGIVGGYIPLHRTFENPLLQGSFKPVRNPGLFAGETIIDSDVFTGSTRNFVESMGGKLVCTMKVNPDETEIIDFEDVATWSYPDVDIAWRCSMTPFTKESHELFEKFALKATSLLNPKS